MRGLQGHTSPVVKLPQLISADLLLEALRKMLGPRVQGHTDLQVEGVSGDNDVHLLLGEEGGLHRAAFVPSQLLYLCCATFEVGFPDLSDGPPAQS